MAKDKVTKRLTTIASLDVAGYSRLMEVDEAGTLAALKARRKVTDQKIGEYGGRIVGTAGDGLLVEFPSVSDAVSCALDVQSLMAERNADMPADRRMEFRMGINLGDVMIEGDDIYGTGVNVAARLQQLAEPGGIVVSRSVFNQVKAIGEIGFRDLGPQKVKNIAEPVPAYKVLLDPAHAGRVLPWRRRPWVFSRRGAAALAALLLLLMAAGVAWWQPWIKRVEAARLDKMAFTLPNKPSIAVLPFNNLSGDKSHDYLADGLSQNIISALSKVSEMFVIASPSVDAYKGRTVKVKEVAEALGVQYVLKGSVQRSGDRIRVTAELIDAVKGHHLWSGKYDRHLTDLFAVQDEITTQIVVELKVKLTEGEQERVRHRSTKNLKAWENYVRGLAKFRRFAKADNARAIALFKEAIALDRNFAAAWAGLAWAHWSDARFRWSAARITSLASAKQAASKALALNKWEVDAHTAMATIYALEGDYPKAISALRKAISLDPNFADAIATLASVLTRIGQPKEAIALLRQAMRLAPKHPPWYSLILGRAYRMTRQFDQAIVATREGVRRNPNSIFFQVELTAVLSEAGRAAEARAAAKEVLRLNPKFTVSGWTRNLRYKDPADEQRIIAALRKAGLPE